MRNNWDEDAACRDSDLDDFFADSSRHEVEAALPGMALCRECPVQRECLDFAIKRKMDFGVWGGRTTEERKAIRAGRMVRAPKLTRAAGRPF